MIGCQVNNGAQTGSEHGSDHAMVRSRLRIKAVRLSNRPAKLDTSKWKTTKLNICLWSYGTGLRVKDIYPEGEWRQPKDAVAEVFQAHLRRMRRNRPTKGYWWTLTMAAPAAFYT